MRRSAGFTLIEILVAMSLLALLGVLGYRGLESIRQTATALSDKAQRWQAIALAVDRLGSDARQAVSVPGRDAAGGELPAWHGRRLPAPAPDAAQLVLTRIGNAGSDLQRLAYRWQETQLELLIWPAHDAPAPARHYPLLDGIADLEFAYLDRQNRWLADWPAGQPGALPRALRLRLTLVEGGTIERIFDVAASD